MGGGLRCLASMLPVTDRDAVFLPPPPRGAYISNSPSAPSLIRAGAVRRPDGDGGRACCRRMVVAGGDAARWSSRETASADSRGKDILGCASSQASAMPFG